MTTYTTQAEAVKLALGFYEETDKRLGIDSSMTKQALRDAATTLNALALFGDKELLENAKLRMIVLEFIQAGEMHPMEIKAYRDDFERILKPKKA